MEDMGASGQISDDQVKTALEEVDAEIMADSGSQLPSARTSKLANLKIDIDKLKQQGQ
jgi:hypothetical protein